MILARGILQKFESVKVRKCEKGWGKILNKRQGRSPRLARGGGTDGLKRRPGLRRNRRGDIPRLTLTLFAAAINPMEEIAQINSGEIG
jgi:hypothetical protein